MKKLMILMVTVALMVAMAGCNQPQHTQLPSVFQPSVGRGIQFDEQNCVTVGNNTWLALNIARSAADNKDIILEALRFFEDSRPNLEVLDWEIEKRANTYCTTPYTYGLWIHHRPKVVEKTAERFQ